MWGVMNISCLSERVSSMRMLLEGVVETTERVDDERLKRRVISTLRASGYLPLSRIECRVTAGVVELFGCVPNFFLKQMAQSAVQRLGNVKEIRNEVLVG